MLKIHDIFSKPPPYDVFQIIKGDLSVGGQDTQCGARDEAIAYNLAQNITYEAWSPMKNCPFNNSELVKIAAAYVLQCFTYTHIEILK